VPPELAAAKVVVYQRLGANTIDIATVSGVVLARHQVTEPGLGVTIRDSGHVTALEGIEAPWVCWRLLTLETRMESWCRIKDLGSRRRVGIRRRRRLLRSGW
jgi:hypothetical protein